MSQQTETITARLEYKITRVYDHPFQDLNIDHFFIVTWEYKEDNYAKHLLQSLSTSEIFVCYKECLASYEPFFDEGHTAKNYLLSIYTYKGISSRERAIAFLNNEQVDPYQKLEDLIQMIVGLGGEIRTRGLLLPKQAQ